MELPTRCARPTLGHRGVSTYTVLGFVGYAVGNAVVALLMVMWGMSITERVIAAFVPPLTFLVVVRAMRKLVGHERIVFYEIAASRLSSSEWSALSWARTWRDCSMPSRSASACS